MYLYLYVLISEVWALHSCNINSVHTRPFAATGDWVTTQLPPIGWAIELLFVPCFLLWWHRSACAHALDSVFNLCVSAMLVFVWTFLSILSAAFAAFNSIISWHRFRRLTPWRCISALNYCSTVRLCFRFFFKVQCLFVVNVMKV